MFRFTIFLELSSHLGFPASIYLSNLGWRSTVRTRRMVGTGFSCLKSRPTGCCDQRAISTALTLRSTKEGQRGAWSGCATSSINPGGQPPSQKCLPATVPSSGGCPGCGGMQAVHRCLRRRYSTISSLRLWWKEKESSNREASPLDASQSQHVFSSMHNREFDSVCPMKLATSVQFHSGELDWKCLVILDRK